MEKFPARNGELAGGGGGPKLGLFVNPGEGVNPALPCGGRRKTPAGVGLKAGGPMGDKPGERN
jgi:hypothetical protein